MYINKNILLLIMLFSFNGCNKIADGPSYEVYLKGNTIRAFDVINDTLFVAIENSGVMIYEINNDKGLITLDSLSFSSVVGNPVSLDVAEQSRMLIVLDDYNYTYAGQVDFFADSDDFYDLNKAVSCDEYQRKSTFIDYSDKPIELITPFRHKPTQNEVDSLAWNTSFIHRVIFPEAEYNLGFLYGDCSDTLHKYLNYNIEDVYYNNEKLYLVSPDTSEYSVAISNHNTSEDFFTPADTIRNLSAIPLTVKSNDTHIFVGLDDNQGCYIKLLDSNNENNSNFTIAPGYDIQDIDLSSNHITLSAGYNGALIYDSNFELVALLDGLYAYRAMMYDDFNIIVGTKDGLCIYQLER